MTSSHIKEIHDAIGEAAKPVGFAKKGASWYADRAESILVINPQKSQYSERYYLNLGIYFKELGTERAPKEVEKFHLQARISDVTAEDEKIIDKIFDFEEPMTSSERTKEIITLLREAGLPFLEACSSMEGARAAYAKDQLSALPLLRELREKLERA